MMNSNFRARMTPLGLASMLLAAGCGGGGGGFATAFGSGEPAAALAVASASPPSSAPAPAPEATQQRLLPADRDALQAQARQEGYASVMLTLRRYSLADLAATDAQDRLAAVEAQAVALRGLLGPQALETGYWNSGLGQVGLLVTAEGLRLLEQAGQVLSIQPDTTRASRDRAWVPAEHRSAIQAALNAHGVAEADLILNSDIAYALAADGATVYQPSPQAAAEHLRLLGELAASPAGKSLQVLDDAQARAGASAALRVRFDRAAWYGLRMAPQVRALRAPGVQVPAQWPAKVQEAAAAQGQAEVIITLNGGQSYSALGGYMSEAARAVQRVAHRAALDAVLADIGTAGPAPQVHADIGAVSVRLPRQAVDALYARRDPRIRDVQLNEPVGGLFGGAADSGPVVEFR